MCRLNASRCRSSRHTAQFRQRSACGPLFRFRLRASHQESYRGCRNPRGWRHHFFGISRDTPRPIRTGRNDSFHYIGVPRGSCRISAVSGARGWVRMTSTVSVRTFTDADVSRKKSDLSAGKNEWFFAFIPGGTWYGVSLAYFGQPIHVHWKA
jgi:hypothetical protein